MKNYKESWNCSSSETEKAPQEACEAGDSVFDLVEQTHSRIEALWGYMAEAFTSISTSAKRSEERLERLENRVESLAAEMEGLCRTAKDSELNVKETLSSSAADLHHAIAEMRREQLEQFRDFGDRVFDLLAKRFHAAPSAALSPQTVEKTASLSAHNEAQQRAVTAEIRPVRQALISREELMRCFEEIPENKPRSFVLRHLIQRFAK